MTQLLHRPAMGPLTGAGAAGGTVPDRRPTRERTHVQQSTELDLWWAEWKAGGDVELRNRLVLQYSPLVKYVAGRVRSVVPGSVDHADLVSEGMIGLIDALEKFEPQRGLAFPTYAVPRIRGAIIDSIRAADWVPRSVRERSRDVARTREDLQRMLGRAATDEEVAGKLGWDPAEVAAAAQPKVWVNATSEDLAALEETGSALGDALEDDDTRALLMPAVHALPERDRIVVALYFFEGLTLAEIGRVLGITESRVSQIRSRATRQLRAALADLG